MSEEKPTDWETLLKVFDKQPILFWVCPVHRSESVSWKTTTDENINISVATCNKCGRKSAKYRNAK